MNLEYIIDKNMGLKQIGKKLLIGLIGLGTFFNGTPQIQNKEGIKSASQYMLNLGFPIAYAQEKGPLEKQGYHPLYDVLLKNAKDKQLKNAIVNLAHHNYKTASFILLPEYYPWDRYTNVISTKMDRNKMGGNNPTYWVALKLASEGVGDPGLYSTSFYTDTKGKFDVPLPTDKKILKFAASINPKKHWVLWDGEKEKRKMNEFIDKIKSTNLFKY